MIRFRRIRKLQRIRDLVSETEINTKNLVYPLFVVHGKKIRRPVQNMPGCFQFSVDTIVKEVVEIKKLKIPAIILFGIPKKKDPLGKEAYAENGIIQQAIRAIKKEIKDIIIITDVCLCEYTSHGHCCIFPEDARKIKEAKEKGTVSIELKETLSTLASIALSQVEAGTDIVAPSDMMDGRVKAIRTTLDENGFDEIPILSYSAKYASAFYGPFKQAVESSPAFGDRKSYQINPRNIREAIREILDDIDEGADIVMVKPALAYLDVISQARNRILNPIAAYNVSGEYAMVKSASQKGWINEKDTVLEILTSIKRAGADFIITYHAKEAAAWLS